MSANEALAGRLETVETRLAYQERTIEELNGVIAEQWREIERLQRSLARLNEQIAEIEQGAGSELPEAPPPHY